MVDDEAKEFAKRMLNDDGDPNKALIEFMSSLDGVTDMAVFYDAGKDDKLKKIALAAGAAGLIAAAIIKKRKKNE